MTSEQLKIINNLIDLLESPYDYMWISQRDYSKDPYIEFSEEFKSLQEKVILLKKMAQK